MWSMSRAEEVHTEKLWPGNLAALRQTDAIPSIDFVLFFGHSKFFANQHQRHIIFEITNTLAKKKFGMVSIIFVIKVYRSFASQRKRISFGCIFDSLDNSAEG